MRPIPHTWLAVVALLGFSATFVACDSGSTLVERFEPEGSYTLSWTDLPGIEGGSDLRMGGFVGLTYVGGRDFYTVLDRGPVLGDSENDSSRFFVAPSFTPEIARLSLQDDGTIKLTERIPLLAAGGQPVSGLPPPKPWRFNETVLNESSPDAWGLYPGGLVMDRKNHFFWVADHYGPSLLQVTVQGEILRRVRGDNGLRAAYLTRRNHGGFAGIDVEPSGDILAVMRRSLNNSVSADDVVNDSLRRVVRFSPGNGEERSFFYMVNPEAVDGIPPHAVELSGLAVVRNNEFLVTEQADVAGQKRSLLFAVTLTDSSTSARRGLEGIIGKTIETLTETEWREAGLIPVAKRLVADLTEMGIDRPEGVAIVGKRKVAILEAGGYGIVDGDPHSQSYGIQPRDVRIVIIELAEEL